MSCGFATAKSHVTCRKAGKVVRAVRPRTAMFDGAGKSCSTTSRIRIMVVREFGSLVAALRVVRVQFSKRFPSTVSALRLTAPCLLNVH